MRRLRPCLKTLVSKPLSQNLSRLHSYSIVLRYSTTRLSCYLVRMSRPRSQRVPRVHRSTKRISTQKRATTQTTAPSSSSLQRIPPCGVQVNLRLHQRRVVDQLLATSPSSASSSFLFTGSPIPPHRLLFVAPTGSGKTIAAIVSGVCLMQRGVVTGVHVVAPKSVVPQFQHEVERIVPLEWQERFWVTTHNTYFRATRSSNSSSSSSVSSSASRTAHTDPRGKLLVIDEAHGLVTSIVERRTTRTSRTSRTPPSTHRHRPTFQSGQRAYYAVRAARRAKALLLLTATPLQNSPTDILNLLCMVLGQTASQFYAEPNVRAVKKALLQMHTNYIRSANPRHLDTLKHANIYLFLRQVAPLVAFAQKSTEGLPTVDHRTVSLTMEPEYLQLYNAVEGDQMNVLRRQLLAQSKSKSNTDSSALSSTTVSSPIQCVFEPDALDAFYLKLRRAVNGVTQNVVSAKVDYAVRIAREGQRQRRRVLIYSSFLNGGLSLVEHQLRQQQPHSQPLSPAPVPYVKIVGQHNQAERHAAAQALNAGRVYVMLLSRAGSEGLDLKGVRDVVLLEPHFHNERMQQVIGRAVRYRSHEALPPDERNVVVHHLLLRKPNDDSTQWEATEQHNESVIRRLVTEQRDRAQLGTLRLVMNETSQLVYRHMRTQIWSDILQSSQSHRRPGRLPRDPFDAVVVDTKGVSSNDPTIYVQYTDTLLPIGGPDGSDYSNDSESESDSNSDRNSDRDSNSNSHSNRSSSHKTNQTTTTIPSHAQYTLRNTPRDVSVDDIIQQMAQRKAKMNETFLMTLKRLSGVQQARLHGPR